MDNTKHTQIVIDWKKATEILGHTEAELRDAAKELPKLLSTNGTYPGELPALTIQMYAYRKQIMTINILPVEFRNPEEDQ